MFHIVAASSLFHSINTLNTGEKKQYESLVTAIPGLSLNNNLLNQGKNLRRLLEDSPLKEKKVVVWHDVVNTTISSHRTVTFDQNGQNAVSAEFGILAASLPNWRFRTDKDVI